MSDKPFDAKAYVEAASAALQVPVAAEHLPGVIANMERVAMMARLVMDFPLPDEAEAGPVFQP